jgi:predicted  nucleic acid-binding Zn-ribbon protein
MSLEKLWEKARRVSDLVLRLKEENQELRSRVSALEQAEAQWKSTLLMREQEVERLRSEVAKLQSNGSQLFSQEEKEALKQRIKDLIVKINARL